MSIRFIIDSASDILPEMAKALGLVHIPLTVTFGDQQYQDAITLSHRQFYEKLVESDILPTTSQVTPGAYIEAIRPLVEAGETVIILALSSVLSGTYQSACIAAAEFPGKVYVIDTLTVCVGERLLALRGLELAREGLPVEEVVACLEREKTNIRVLAVLDTLEYLKKGGRISATTAFAGGLLSIKPVIAVRNGAVELCGKARGSKNSNNLLRKFIRKSRGVDFARPYCVAYSGLDDSMLQKYIEDNADLWQTNTHALPVSTVGCVIGTHAGPGAIAVAYFEKAE